MKNKTTCEVILFRHVSKRKQKTNTKWKKGERRSDKMEVNKKLWKRQRSEKKKRERDETK